MVGQITVAATALGTEGLFAAIEARGNLATGELVLAD